jgi:hypothetical protein
MSLEQQLENLNKHLEKLNLTLVAALAASKQLAPAPATEAKAPATEAKAEKKGGKKAADKTDTEVLQEVIAEEEAAEEAEAEATTSAKLPKGKRDPDYFAKHIYPHLVELSVKNKPALVAINQHFGVKKASELAAEKWDELFEKVSEALAPAEDDGI